MTVKELIQRLGELNQDQEIRYDSYEYSGDFDIEDIEDLEYKGVRYYNIV